MGSQLIGSCRASALVLHLPPCEGFLSDFTHHDAFSKCSKTVVRPSKSKVGYIRATKTNLQRLATSFQLSPQQHGTSMSHRRQSNHFCRNNRNTLGIWMPTTLVLSSVNNTSVMLALRDDRFAISRMEMAHAAAWLAVPGHASSTSSQSMCMSRYCTGAFGSLTC